MPGADEAHHLQRRERLHDLLGEANLELGRRAVGGAATGRRDHRLEHFGMGVSQDERTPGEDEVHVLVAVDVGQPGTLPARDEAGSAAHAAERAHRTVDPARQHLLRPGKEPFRHSRRHPSPPPASHFATSFE